MNHTVCSLEHIRRESIEGSRSSNKKPSLTPSENGTETPMDGNPRSSVKFGVELKRTHSQQSQGRRKSSSAEIPHVEEVFELDLLEKMLETVVGYEQRRRIRSQIRIVKKQKLQQQIQGSTSKQSRNGPMRKEPSPAPARTQSYTPASNRTKSPQGKEPQRNLNGEKFRRDNSKEIATPKTQPVARSTSPKSKAPIQPETGYKSRSPSPRHNRRLTNDHHKTAESEYTSQYSKSSNVEKVNCQSTAPETYVSRSPSPKAKLSQRPPETYVSRRSPSPKSNKSGIRSQTTTDDRESEYTAQYCRSSTKTQANTSQRQELRKSRSPSPKTAKTSTPSATSARIIPKTVDAKDREADKPIWATKNILKKATETSATRTFKMSTPKKITQKVQKQKTIDTAVEDCVISSYGIGPTDDDGKPLFGIRALKKKAQPSQTTKGLLHLSQANLYNVNNKIDISFRTVTGTILKESLYSENGSTPSGSRSLTHYSNNPDDLKQFEDYAGERVNNEVEHLNNGITSITRTEKIEVKPGASSTFVCLRNGNVMCFVAAR